MVEGRSVQALGKGLPFRDKTGAEHRMTGGPASWPAVGDRGTRLMAPGVLPRVGSPPGG